MSDAREVQKDSTNPSLPLYFLLLFVLSVPFWVLGALVKPEGLPINIPISALMAFNPMLAALILVYREHGAAEVQKLLRKPFVGWRIRPLRWYLSIFLLMPALLLLSYGLAVLMGRGAPDPQFSLLMLPVMLAVFMISAYGEELGWQGYVFEPLQARRGTLGAGIVIGVVWAVWHIIPYIQTQNTISWIFWQCVYTVALRLLIVWVYTHTGRSIFAAMVVHATSNVAAFMIPNNGSHYDPFLAAVITIAVAALLYRRQAQPG